MKGNLLGVIRSCLEKHDCCVCNLGSLGNSEVHSKFSQGDSGSGLVPRILTKHDCFMFSYIDKLPGLFVNDSQPDQQLNRST